MQSSLLLDPFQDDLDSNLLSSHLLSPSIVLPTRKQKAATSTSTQAHLKRAKTLVERDYPSLQDTRVWPELPGDDDDSICKYLLSIVESISNDISSTSLTRKQLQRPRDVKVPDRPKVDIPKVDTRLPSIVSTRIDTCINTCVDTSVDTSVDTRVDTSVDKSSDKSIATSHDTNNDISTNKNADKQIIGQIGLQCHPKTRQQIPFDKRCLTFAF